MPGCSGLQREMHGIFCVVAPVTGFFKSKSRTSSLIRLKNRSCMFPNRFNAMHNDTYTGNFRPVHLTFQRMS